MPADPNDDSINKPDRKLADPIPGESDAAGDASLDSTGDHGRQDTNRTCSFAEYNRDREDKEEESPPAQLADGRFIVERILGQGGFGFVCLAQDTAIQRHVAIKIPNKRFFGFGNSVAQFLEEAQKAASLDKHVGIVTIHDVGQEEDGRPYIVMEYIEGNRLDGWCERARPDHRDVVTMLVKIADAVGVAHRNGLYHRDLKPANILVDGKGEPHVADFGLALRDGLRRAQIGEVSGTAAYMAPEQVRGETHRIDGRADIWALGVILYELLAGMMPFSAANRDTLFQEITTVTPRPLRQLDARIPSELSRICEKCLEPRRTDRYPSVADLIDDLQHWLDASSRSASAGDAKLAVPVSTVQLGVAVLPKIVPKGLRSFDEHDADFFLELLPGPRDREGLPDSLRFWKTRVEETDPDRTFSIGLVYGPSGCGKSSLMKAGLLPRLDANVVAIYLEATPDDTERQLLKAIRKQVASPAEDSSLTTLCAQVRDQGLAGRRKLLIVLDQFEQWLQAHGTESQAELVQALRHCDGGRLQCVLMVRDDFWLGISRFMRTLELPLLEGDNSALVDLFDLDHATKVLTAFGRAYGRLPELPAEPSAEQRRFMDQAIGDLAQNDKVISVRLSLFAEMLKGKPWTPATLADMAGVEGVGVRFLEETFRGASAPPEHKRQEPAARALLECLLPEVGSDIKGSRRSEDELRNMARSTSPAVDFDGLLRTLNGELKLITPVEIEEATSERSANADGDANPKPSPESDQQAYYQLTHDYLVPSLRRWLRQKDTESFRGRARLRLLNRALLYQSKPERQQLPTWWEYFNITALTRKRDWTEPQRRMMSAARRYYLTRSAALAVLLIGLAWGGREVYCRVTSAQLVNSLSKAGADKVLDAAGEIPGYLPWAREDLQEFAAADAETVDDRRQKLHARLTLVPTDDQHVLTLMESLLTTESPNYIGVIRAALQPSSKTVVPPFWQEFQTESGDTRRRFRAGLTLADYAPDSPQWTDTDYRFLVQQLVTSNPEYQPIYRSYLTGVAANCLPELEAIFEKGQSSEVRLAAANAIFEFAHDDQPRIARMLTIATARQYEILFPLIAGAADDAVMRKLAEQAASPPPDDMASAARLPYGKQRAGAAITLLRLGGRETVLPVFEVTDDPEALTQFIHCKDRGVRAEELLELLRLVCDQPTDRSDSPSQVHARYALLLALGAYPLDEIPPAQRDALLKDLADWYAHDPSSALHGAAGWLLRQWRQDEVVRQVDQTAIAYSPDREWFTLAMDVTPRIPDAEDAAVEDSADSSQEANTSATSEETPIVANSDTTEDRDTTENAATAAEAQEPTPPAKQTFYMTFIVFAAGEYEIGSLEDEPDHRDDEIRHTVKITRPVVLLDREVTFTELIAFDPQFASFMQQYDAKPEDAGFAPMWYDAVQFCHWLSEQSGFAEADQSYPAPESLDEDNYPRETHKDAVGAARNWPLRLEGRGFRLPTESEWEAACRAGMRTMYGQGADVGLLGHYAWSVENSGKHVHPPKSRLPGLRGLYDMHGNLFELCHDWNGDFVNEADLPDPHGPDEGSSRIFRGGCWGEDAAGCRSSFRGGYVPTYRSYNLGFRLAIVPSRQLAEPQEQ